MPRYWDIHNHILPGVDDGASCLEESLEMIEEEHRQGIRNIIFTPHFRPQMFEISGEQRRKVFEDVVQNVSSKYPDMHFYLGCELFYNHHILEQLTDSANCMKGTRIVLVEFPTEISFAEMKRGIAAILDAGYRVIIAHVERYAVIREAPERLRILREAGCLVQVNAEIVLSRRRMHRRFVETLIANGDMDCIASDAHRTVNRTVKMKKAREFVKKKYGVHTMKRLFEGNIDTFLSKQ